VVVVGWGRKWDSFITIRRQTGRVTSEWMVRPECKPSFIDQLINCICVGSCTMRAHAPTVWKRTSFERSAAHQRREDFNYKFAPSRRCLVYSWLALLPCRGVSNAPSWTRQDPIELLHRWSSSSADDVENGLICNDRPGTSYLRTRERGKLSMRSLGPFSSEEPGASNILLAKYTGSCFYQWSTGAIYEGTDGPGHPLVVEEGTAVTYQERRKARKLEPCGWESLTANENGGGGSSSSRIGPSQDPCPLNQLDSFSNNFTNICGLSSNLSSVEHHRASSSPHILLLSETQLLKDVLVNS